MKKEQSPRLHPSKANSKTWGSTLGLRAGIWKQDTKAHYAGREAPVFWLLTAQGQAGTEIGANSAIEHSPSLLWPPGGSRGRRFMKR